MTPPGPKDAPLATLVRTSIRKDEKPDVFAVALLDYAALAPVVRAGPKARKRFVEFFTAEIRNAYTRAAYGQAALRFFAWCQARQLELEAIEPVHVAAYIEELKQTLSTASIKQHLAALKRLFDYLVTGHALAANPATPVRGPKAKTTTGKTPALNIEEAQKLHEVGRLRAQQRHRVSATSAAVKPIHRGRHVHSPSAGRGRRGLGNHLCDSLRSLVLHRAPKHLQ